MRSIQTVDKRLRKVPQRKRRSVKRVEKEIKVILGFFMES